MFFFGQHESDKLFYLQQPGGEDESDVEDEADTKGDVPVYVQHLGEPCAEHDASDESDQMEPIAPS